MNSYCRKPVLERLEITESLLCVRIAAEADEELGVAPLVWGFQVACRVPFGRPLSEFLVMCLKRSEQV